MTGQGGGGPRFELLDPDETVYGRADQVSPTIRRVMAQNPSKFTYLGTGTFLVGRGDVVVVDPGPLLDSHRDALAAALEGERVRAILVTHCHGDHSPLAEWLKAETGAPTVAYGSHPRPVQAQLSPVSGVAGETGAATVEETTDFDFEPDLVVRDGDVAFEGAGMRFTAVHTPGHTSNHTCFAYEDESVLFTGDHVMGWSTTVVAPPDGDMAAYLSSLHKVAARGDRMLVPTHGPPRYDGPEYVRSLIDHRLERERQVVDAVASGLATVPEMVAVLYADVRPELHEAAGKSVLAHLVKLVDERRIAVVPGTDAAGTPRYRLVAD